MKKSYTLLLASIIATSLVLPAIADPGNGKGNSQTHKNTNNKGHTNTSKPDKGDKAYTSPVQIHVTFDHARSLARQYGLTGYESLPPGIAKNLARGKPLPPGIAKQHLPSSILHDLPNYSGHEWVRIGRDLVLLAVATGIIVDVVNDVFS